MQTLSYTQEYYLCAVNDKGNPKSFKSDEVAACLLVGGIAELVEQGLIARDEKKRFVVVRPWDDSLPYLKPLYEALASFKKPKNIKGLAESYLLGLNHKLPDELMATIGASLVAANCADELTDQGLLKNKTRYAPKPEAVTRAIEKLRAEFLEEGVVADETLCLAAFLDKSGLIRDYFSKVEKETLKKRLREVREREASASVKQVLDEITAVYAVITITVNAVT
ncbi:MAG: GPP34 family phosphoprotein [Coriobacteriales bacterium]|jgi:hypothetical protein|nr:GPP34 family phosphoprotein [Coriobacteriales bacterium]